MNQPENIPLSPSEERAATATQLGLLLDAAKQAIDEEFKRTERLEQKARNQATFTATLYAGVQALVVGLFNGLLSDGDQTSGFVPYMAILGAIATLVAVGAFAASYRAWKLHTEALIGISSITSSAYVDAAAAGKQIVGIKLIDHYKKIALERRAVNEARVRSLSVARAICFVATLVLAAEIILAFIAVAIR